MRLNYKLPNDFQDLSDQDLYLEIFDSASNLDQNTANVNLQDEIVREINILRDRKLCMNCSGTGNEHQKGFRKCFGCEGRGYNE